jgi:hypothetical protein
MTITVQMLQTRKGIAGADLLVGQTYDLDNDLAIDLVGKNFATDVHNVISLGKDANADNGLVATPAQVAALAAAGTPVPAGTLLRSSATSVVYGQSDGLGGYAGLGGSGGGSTTTGSSDLTAAPTVGAYGLTNYTAGADYVITYDGVGVPLTRYLAGDVTLKADLVSGGSGFYFVNGGIKELSGALVMTLAQRNTWLALGPTIAVGFRIFVSDVGQIIDSAGNTIVPGAFAVYAGPNLGFIWENGVTYSYYQSGTSVVGGTNAASRTVVIPATVTGNSCKVTISFWWNLTGAAGTRTLRVLANGTVLNTSAALSSAQLSWIGVKSFFGNAASLQYISSSGALGDVIGQSTSALQTMAINLQTTALTIVFDATNTGPDTAILVRADIRIEQSAAVA